MPQGGKDRHISTISDLTAYKSIKGFILPLKINNQ